ncbi:MAG: methylmalonyl Co-A mutase-associated GTPase MeaB [Syntrophales bacterium]|jgi:LAO/AO transport system kinase|nr:methylmalonyl Co-A mutase-associated GTPase MeaB [Syntrophales bacterium]MCU0554348.1 methylmalonyl Co-A mutase-associated GTPase MeaB [Syntrophales bacterium]MCU0583472.1 methylmalonyl Co-A mutase-associated GTPase MeaB [Syntrophales bacterium]
MKRLDRIRDGVMQNKGIDYYAQGVIGRNRLVMAKTITLIESTLPAHQELARQVMDALLPHTGKAVRLGITGVPGAGKSTFIESFGMMLTEKGLRVAVLAVDPSSPRTGGSILADKTRMEKLSVNEQAFIRPSPSGGTLGGVARKTRETMMICEAAGYDVIMVETVGVGQSEVAVASMVDFFLVLMIAGAGDELQGIKKGVLELADAITVNKADGDNVERAKLARQQYETAMHLLSPPSPDWSTPVLMCSSLAGSGLEDIWETVLKHRKIMNDKGDLEKKRSEQSRLWMWALVKEGLEEWFSKNAQVVNLLPLIEKEVVSGKITATSGAARILSFLQNYDLTTT